MANITITNVNLGSVGLMDNTTPDELITFGGAATLLEGTILARDSASGKMVPFVKGGVTNENGIPKAVLGYEVTAAGAGDVAARPIESGRVRKEKLIIDADGDGSNVDDVVLDQLRDYGIVATSVTGLAELDNQ